MSEAVKTGIERACAAVGGQSILADLLRPKVRPQAVQEWIKHGWAPVGRVRQIESLTGVPRKELVKPEIAELFD